MEVYSHPVNSDSDDCDGISDNLVNSVDKVLKIQDVHRKEHASEDDDSEVEEKNEFQGHLVFSSSRNMFDFSSSDEESGKPESSKESLRKAYALAMSLPSPTNLVSAMKGSREKEGGSQRKLTVTWAPDVYDPPPTQLELILSRGAKQQKLPKKEKKSGKKGQKGKDFSRGVSSSKESSRSGVKDKKKKQHRGAGAGSRRYNRFSEGDYDDMESSNSGVLDSTCESGKASSHWSGRNKKKQTGGMAGKFRRYDLPPSDSDEDEEVEVGSVEAGSPDPQCGSSFLKGSLKEVHYSVAKAL